MNVNDPLFTDLALKVIAGRGSEAERSELAARVASHPEFEAELESLQADVAFAKEVLPLLGGEHVKAAELPGYARARLRAAVRRSLGNPPPPQPTRKAVVVGMVPQWGWWLGLATAAAVGLIVVSLNSPRLTKNPRATVAIRPLPQHPPSAETHLELSHAVPSGDSPPLANASNLGGLQAGSAGQVGIPRGPEAVQTSNGPPIAVLAKDDARERGKQTLASTTTGSTPVIQLAMLDSVGQTRGSATPGSTADSAIAGPQGNPQVIAALKEALHQTNLIFFSEMTELTRWLGEWPIEKERIVFKVCYDRDAGEVRVAALLEGGIRIDRKIAVTTEQDLSNVLQTVSDIKQQQSK